MLAPILEPLCMDASRLPLGTVDASVVAAAERPGLEQLATLDRVHFAIVRPAHAVALEIVPSLL
jgi:predicted nucleic acid-binding protein